MGNIYFVNRYFYPDLSATSQMLTDLTAHLAQAGEAVVVVTSRQGYEDAAAAFAPRESAFGVEVRRIATTRFGRANLIGRALDYLSFYFSAFWFLLLEIRHGDIVVAKTDPPLVSVVVVLASCLSLRLFRGTSSALGRYGEACALDATQFRLPWQRGLPRLRDRVPGSRWHLTRLPSMCRHRATGR